MVSTVVPIAMTGSSVTKVTPYRKKVYDACSRIPKGMVSTYKLLAEEIDCNSAQAVGQALCNNPFAPKVPCHRVISSKLQLHGFHGKTNDEALVQKRKMLEDEGVRFDDQGRVQPDFVFKFSDRQNEKKDTHDESTF